ncbi:MAG TPA: hypothetical protein VM689_02840 [Aliidongia sp.]|nr:hypothetical protein [Aliidongia sp.]
MTGAFSACADKMGSDEAIAQKMIFADGIARSREARRSRIGSGHVHSPCRQDSLTKDHGNYLSISQRGFSVTIVIAAVTVQEPPSQMDDGHTPNAHQILDRFNSSLSQLSENLLPYAS